MGEPPLAMKFPEAFGRAVAAMHPELAAPPYALPCEPDLATAVARADALRSALHAAAACFKSYAHLLPSPRMRAEFAVLSEQFDRQADHPLPDPIRQVPTHGGDG
jgi:predicted trehalose synthase